MSKHYFPKILSEGIIFKFDHYFLLQRKKINNTVLNKFFQFLAVFDEKYLLMVISYGVIFHFLENKYDIFQFAILVTLSDQLSKRLVKDRFKRRRPAKFLVKTEGKPNIFTGFRGYTKKAISSMCSSHSANFLAQALLIQSLTPILTVYFFPLFLMIGIARWFIGAHWVSDIFVGWIMGYISFIIHTKYLYPYLSSFF